MQILIDEVHHATDSDIKLRQVVNRWNERGNVNSVLGFSGTPYLEKKEKTKEFWNGKIFSEKHPLRMKVRNIAGDESIIDLNQD